MTEEIVFGDLVREIDYRLVCGLGYFEAHRLWTIFDELKARDLEHLSHVLDASQAVDEKRSEIFDWLKSRQPRRHVPEKIPDDIIKQLKANWELN